MIIFDHIGHMVSTASEDELHAFAQEVGLKREWFQNKNKNPHYDLTTLRAKRRALRAGAKYVDSISLIKRAWWYRGSYHEKILEKI